jgi:hypothetical protein
MSKIEKKAWGMGGRREGVDGDWHKLERRDVYTVGDVASCAESIRAHFERTGMNVPTPDVLESIVGDLYTDRMPRGIRPRASLTKSAGEPARIVRAIQAWNNGGGYLGGLYNAKWRAESWGEDTGVSEAFDRLESVYQILRIVARGARGLETSNAMKAWGRTGIIGGAS